MGSDGAAAAVLMTEAAVKKWGLEGQAIEIVGQAMATDLPSAFEGGKPDTAIHAIGASMCERAAHEVYQAVALARPMCKLLNFTTVLLRMNSSRMKAWVWQRR